MTELVGYIGTTVAVIAYLPQIIHLIKEKCSAGISLRTYGLWCVSSLLLLIHAFQIHAMVFVIFQICNMVAVLIILYFGKKYQGMVCPFHRKS